MKKNIFILLCLIICFNLSGCKSQNAVLVDEKILAIDESNITLDLETEIGELRYLYDDLSEKEKETLDNKEKYNSIIEKYDSIEATKIADIEGKIGAIPEIEKISLSSKDVISVANDAYNNTIDSVKSKVSNSEHLKLAVEQIEQLEANEIEKKINAIPSLGSMTLSSKNAVKSAEEAYNSAGASVKNKVKNKDKLDASLDKIEELREATWTNCSKCGGSGTEKCINCKGVGMIRWYASEYDEGWVDDCPMCDGKGYYTCETCDGAGGKYRD